MREVIKTFAPFGAALDVICCSKSMATKQCFSFAARMQLRSLSEGKGGLERAASWAGVEVEVEDAISFSASRRARKSAGQ